MPDTTLTVRADAPIGTISPRLYGHFAEHLGRCCYGGLWVGTQERTIAHQRGFRSDVLQALQALPVPLLRWPGGCYADHYHWRDGIGPAAQRPIRLGMSCGLQVEDDNSLGTHEFLDLCKLLGAEPYLAGNMGSGSVQELCDWLEYCNSAVPTTLARERAANGSAEPFGVKLWGVGNENWGCGGNYEAATYAREYVRYATMLRHVNPAAELVACGFEKDWNIELLATIGKHLDLVDHLSIHRYWTHGGAETEFSESDYYNLLAEAHETESFVRQTAAIIRAALSGEPANDVDLSEGESATELVVQSARAGQKRIGIALDEWGVWHPEARPWGPGGITPRDPVTYEQANTLRDAIAAGIALEGFHRQCNVLSLANLAQIVNVLQAVVITDGPRMWLTPTYHVLRLHQPHIGATALPVAITQGDTLPNGTSAVSATASRSNGMVAITLINRHYRQAAVVRIGGIGSSSATGQLLTADSPNATNSMDNPEQVAPKPYAVEHDGNGYRIELPPHALATVVFRS